MENRRSVRDLPVVTLPSIHAIETVHQSSRINFEIIKTKRDSSSKKNKSNKSSKSKVETEEDEEKEKDEENEEIEEKEGKIEK